MEMIPKVVQAVAGQDFTVYAYFHDGTVRLLDAATLVQKGGVFTPLRDADFFRDRLTVVNDTVAWDMDGTRDPGTCFVLWVPDAAGSGPTAHAWRCPMGAKSFSVKAEAGACEPGKPQQAESPAH